MAADGSLPAALEDELPTIEAAIGPAVHSALPADEHTTRVARSAALACCTYAPAAPVEVLVEAAIRAGGWMIGTAPHVRSKMIEFPDGTKRSVEGNVAMTANPLRHSGASALLAPYRVLRGFEGV